MKGAYAAWTQFWHAPPDLKTVALVRTGMGLLIALWFGLQLPWLMTWWGPSGLVPPEVAKGELVAGEPSLLLLPGAGEGWVLAGAALGILQGLFLAVGWKPRVQAVCLFVLLVSFMNRNLFILDGEDGMFRLVTFLLVFLPLGHRWSVDAALRARRGEPEPEPGSGWALRMLQIQVCLVWLVAGLEKATGSAWVDGTAMHYVLHLDDLYGRLPVPEGVLRSPWVYTPMTWGALAAELLVPFLVWVPRLRKPALVVAIGFHLALEWMMNLYLFEWIMIVAWLSFSRWEDGPPQAAD